ncbi:GDSL-type esterase/lipase family protein [Limnobacter humi]|uniref:GDSL-type esterase/lipase family protein n=1 Tax=Limnobacter humi TaxID=1778671 RepID=A0ABT1WFM5_9BURK|nr:GDSL-type esterase/lipase family protein [Limnobacter humi]MCQ8896321.1 GDSL-type esterase/lipase family protein [Limnobacter humi]
MLTIRRFVAMPIGLTLLLSACMGSGESGPTTGRINSTQVNQSACSNAEGQADARWVSAWGVTRSTGTAPTDTTVRNIARVTTQGNHIRIRFINLSDQPIEIGAATVGLRDGAVGANIKPNSNRVLSFNCGQPGVTIPPNTPSFYSDAIAFPVNNQDDLAISLYVKGTANPGEFGATWTESYKLPNGSGDQTRSNSGAGYGLIDDSRFSSVPGTPLTCNGCLVYAIRDVEVLSSDAQGAMVFLGSSSFHGYNTTQNGYKRISDLLSVKMLSELGTGQRMTIVNRGIGGDTLENASATRLERDVFDTVGVRAVVVWVTNDLADRTADEIIDNYRSVIAKAHSKNIRVFCPTWLPGAQSMQANLNGERKKLNDWILNSGECDGTADYNKTVEAPGGLTYLPQYNSGDFIHSNDAGHALWAQVTPLKTWVEKSR